MCGALRPEAGAEAAGLHLDEDQSAAVEANQVDLAAASAEVALDQAPAKALEPSGDQVLGPAAQSLSGDRHPANAGAAESLRGVLIETGRMRNRDDLRARRDSA